MGPPLPAGFRGTASGCKNELLPMRKLSATITRPRPSCTGMHVTLCALSIFLAGCQEPPLHELQKARQAVERAKQEGAYDYAPDLYSLAESELAIGEEEIHAQARKIFWTRDYSMAIRLMNLAQTDAHQALTLAQEKKQKSSS